MPEESGVRALRHDLLFGLERVIEILNGRPEK